MSSKWELRPQILLDSSAPHEVQLVKTKLIDDQGKLSPKPTFNPAVQLQSENNSHGVKNVLQNKQTKQWGTRTDICTDISQNVTLPPRPVYTLTTVTDVSFAKTRSITRGTLVNWQLILLH